MWTRSPEQAHIVRGLRSENKTGAVSVINPERSEKGHQVIHQERSEKRSDTKKRSRLEYSIQEISPIEFDTGGRRMLNSKLY